jgi:hypothetical protein
MYKSIVVTIVTLLAFAATAAGAAGFSSLEERMSQSEFHSTGLDKLSPGELKALDDWLRAHSVTTTTYVTPGGQPVFYPKETPREVIESRIEGRFTGWYGSSVFKLENGQEWKQAESGSGSCGTVDNPKIKINPTLLGNWLAYIESCRDSVRVERTK